MTQDSRHRSRNHHSRSSARSGRAEGSREWLTRLVWVASVMFLMACGDEQEPMGDSGPTVPTFDFLTLDAFNAYLSTMEIASEDLGLMVNEFSSIVNDLELGVASDYWISEFTRNLIRRLEQAKARATTLRPDHPTLLDAHITDYEGALEDFEMAFGTFLTAINSPGTVPASAVNDPIAAGNVHLAQFDGFLSSLRGGRVSLFGRGVTAQIGP